MHKSIEALAEKVEALRAEIAELDAIESPTAEQVTRFDAALTEFSDAKSEYDKAVERAEKVEAVRTAALNPRNVTPAFSAPNVVVKRDAFDNLDGVARGHVPAAEVRSRALNAIEETSFHGLTDAARQRATELAQGNAGIARHILLTGSEAYRSAFEQILTHGPEMGMALLDGEQRDAMRAALSNTSANGGYSNPWLLDPTIILTNDGSANPFRAISRIETGTTDKWNGITSAGVTAEWLSEAGVAADASPTVGQPSITAIKGAAYIFASYEQEADGQLVSQLPRLIADAKDRLEAAAFAVGAGSTTAPEGVVTGVTAVTASRVSPTTGGTFTTASVADVYNVIEAVPPRHRSKSSWIANYATLSTIRGMDTYGGSSFWANLGAAVPERLLGLPVYESSSMVSTVTTGSNILLAGDFSEYVIYDRIGVEMRYVPVVTDATTARPTGQAGWFAFWRTGAEVVNPNAFRVLKL
jgi:HK97 family phage major capsid protein